MKSGDENGTPYSVFHDSIHRNWSYLTDVYAGMSPFDKTICQS